MGSEWKEYSLGEIIVTNDSTYSPKEAWDFVNYLDTSSITENRVTEIQSLDAKTEKVPSRARRKVSNGDIVYSNVRPNQKHYGLIRNQPENFLVSTGFTTIRADPDVAETEFLYWYISQPQITELLQGIGENTASAYPSIKPSDIEKLQISLPPLPEQKAIAHILGTLDDKIELNRRMNATLEGMAQALFKSWFVDFDPVIDNALAAGNPIPDELAPRAEVRRQALANREAAKPFPAAFQEAEELGWIPEGWDISSFGDVSTCFDRKRIPLSKKQREEKKPGAIPYYGATSIMDFIDEWIFDDTYLLLGEDGSVMKEDGSPFIQYIWGKTWVNNHAHVLQGDDGVSTEHLMLFMQAQDIAPYVTGAVQLKINQKNMNSIPFLNADSDLNQRFTECITPFYERVKKLTEENETLTTLRDTLLPKLISGELRLPGAEQLTEEALT